MATIKINENQLRNVIRKIVKEQAESGNWRPGTDSHTKEAYEDLIAKCDGQAPGCQVYYDEKSQKLEITAPNGQELFCHLVPPSNKSVQVKIGLNGEWQKAVSEQTFIEFVNSFYKGNK